MRLVVGGACLVVVLVGLEVYARQTAAYVVRQRVDHAQTSADLLDPDDIIQSTPDGGRRLIPNVRAVIHNHPFAHRDVHLQINSLGFRGPEVIQPKPADRLRLLVLGDSITMGEGVEDEETYVRRLELALREGTPGVDVVNGGVGDTGTREQIDLLKERGLALDPDVIIVGFYLNDSRPPWGFAGELGARGWLRRHSRLADVLYQKLTMWRWVQQQGEDRLAWISVSRKMDWPKDQAEFSTLVSAAKYDWGSAWDPDSWSSLYPQFVELKTLAESGRRDGRKIVFVVFPVAYQVYPPYDSGFPQAHAREMASKLGFYYLDLLPLLRAHAVQSREPLFYDVCHPTPAGHALIARDIADFIKAKVLAEHPPR
jgi:lysophospholipase L1-like esterase